MMPRSKRRLLALSLLLVARAAGRAVFPSAPKAHLAKISTISVPWVDLRDISKDGMLLLAGLEPTKEWVKSPSDPRVHWNVEQPKLATWSIKNRRVASEVPLQWKAWKQKLPASCNGSDGSIDCIFPRQFKFYGDGSKALGIEGPWLVLIDLKSQREARRILPSQAYLDPKFPGFMSGNLPNGYASLAINPRDNSVATVFNARTQPRLFLFDSGLSKPIESWPLPRYVADICWSPDGKRLAVLYSGQYDEKWEFHGIDTGFTTLHAPDVEIFDPTSETNPVLRFFTGAMEAKIRYSEDGDHLYCISQSKALGYVWLSGDWAKDVIRVFSSRDGNLVRTISGGSSGIRNNFEFSPSGRLLVADASQDARWIILLSLEPPVFEKRGRFVVIDVKTGKVIYRANSRKMFGDRDSPMAFAFSADERLLFVDLNSDKPIEVYSITAGSEPSPR